MTLLESLTAIKDYMAFNLNSALSSAGLSQVPAGNFRVGEPVDKTQIYCSVYFPKKIEDNETAELSVIVMLQLPNIDDAIPYASVLDEVAAEIDPESAGFVWWEKTEIESWPLDDSGSVYALAEITYKKAKDSCE